MAGATDGLTHDEEAALAETGEHISMTERRSMMAERDTTDRYLAAYLADRVGAEFAGAIAGVARFGLFVKLDETGADGLVPISSLGSEYFRFDPDAQTLTGETSRRVLGLGQRVTRPPRRGRADHRRPALRAARGRGPQPADPAAPRGQGRPAAQAREVANHEEETRRTLARHARQKLRLR